MKNYYIVLLVFVLLIGYYVFNLDVYFYNVLDILFVSEKSSFLIFSLFCIILTLILLPFQKKFFNIIQNMQKVNKEYAKLYPDNLAEINNILLKYKIPSKNKILLLLITNVVFWGISLKFISYFELNINQYVSSILSLVFFACSLYYILPIVKSKIKNRVYLFLITIFFALLISTIFNKEEIIFILVQAILFKIYELIYRKKRKIYSYNNPNSVN